MIFTDEDLIKKLKGLGLEEKMKNIKKLEILDLSGKIIIKKAQNLNDDFKCKNLLKILKYWTIQGINLSSKFL
jgi:hypothetical protein